MASTAIMAASTLASPTKADTNAGIVREAKEARSMSAIPQESAESANSKTSQGVFQSGTARTSESRSPVYATTAVAVTAVITHAATMRRRVDGTIPAHNSTQNAEDAMQSTMNHAPNATYVGAGSNSIESNLSGRPMSAIRQIAPNSNATKAARYIAEKNLFQRRPLAERILRDRTSSSSSASEKRASSDDTRLQPAPVPPRNRYATTRIAEHLQAFPLS